MKLSTLLRGIETQSVYEDVEIERVTDKDKDVKENTLFICIDGKRNDGHIVANYAIKKGAVAVVTERDMNFSNQIIVDDSRKAYSIIASNYYDNPSRKIKMIGVTGTNGKTSTAFFIKNLLDSLNYCCGIIGTIYNSYDNSKIDSTLTTPEPMELQSILNDMYCSGCEYCVMEVSSQSLSQKRVWGIEFLVSVITNITPEHLDYHENMDNYIDAKMMLTRQSKSVIINIDDKILSENISKIACPFYTLSTFNNNADYVAKNVECNKDSVKYIFVSNDSIDRISVNIPGKFTVYNSLCAIGVLLNLGFDLQKIAPLTENIKSVSGRMEKIDDTGQISVYIDYAHTPDGIQNVLQCLKEFAKGKIITVFGCGGDRDKTKRAVMGKIVGELSNLSVVTSDNPRTESPLLIINDILKGMEKSQSKIAVIENRYDAIFYALGKAKKGDIVLIAGKGHEKYQIVGNEKLPFDEREIVKKYFNM